MEKNAWTIPSAPHKSDTQNPVFEFFQQSGVCCYLSDKNSRAGN